ncbi:MAG: hypothetical protein HQL39_15840, partial [Alphaproteobacteria bacterium]|nr:hypothetical protein [Alphaproteobacteria bacterium]
GEAERKGQWDTLKAQLLSRHQAEIQGRDAQIAGLRAQLGACLIDAAATAEIVAAKGVPELLMPHVRMRCEVVEENGRQVVRVLDEAGAVRLDGKGRPLAIKDLVAEMRADPVFARAFDGVGTSGGGMSPAGLGGGSAGPAAFTLSRDQAKDPRAYRAARAAAEKAGLLPIIAG